jgi:hypothetical protein
MRATCAMKVHTVLLTVMPLQESRFVILLQMPPDGLGDRSPGLLLLPDRMIQEPEHPEEPCCENPGKQFPSHGVLLFLLLPVIRRLRERQPSFPCEQRLEERKSLMERSVLIARDLLAGTSSAGPSAARRQFVDIDTDRRTLRGLVVDCQN